ncbi:MAG: DHHA1 domain-containing protein, partial [Anaerolineaceae bacterium]
TQDLFQAGALAQQLDAQNSQRKDITLCIQTDAIESALRADPTVPIIFAASPEFNEGVVGLAASHITEALYKPAIIGHQNDTTVVASCRSIPEFDITRALDACADLLVRYGGHSLAAGLTISNDNLPALLERLNALARKALAGLDLVPALGIDREIFLDKLRAEHVPGILDDVRKLEPTGRGNPDAVFCSRNCQVVQAKGVGDGQHLKLVLRSAKNEYDGIAFKQGYWLEHLPEYVDIAYAFEINSYMGRQTLQLNIKDIKPPSTGI